MRHLTHRRLGALACLACAVSLTACLPDDAPIGLRRTPPGAGPMVVFTLAAQPLPDVPFPNDVLARPDGTAATGRRLNLSLEGHTALERRLRAEGLALDGFSGFAPITVRFDGPLDLAALDGRGRPFSADPVLVVCLSPACFGEVAQLDLGRGYYPTAVVDPALYFEGDPREGEEEVLFETVDEDLDGDGVLDPGEDSDGDGVLDRPNVGPDGTPLTWYELESDTLILRPLQPLVAGATYAVVLTEAVVGANGAPVRSPFDWVHHLEQARPLTELAAALAPHGRQIDEVAFAWTFTVQQASGVLETLADGLAGAGPLAMLATEFPADVSRLDRLQTASDESSLLTRDALGERLAVLAGQTFARTDGEALIADYAAVDHLVAGRFVSPALLVDDDGLAEDDPRYPADRDETLRLGEAPVLGRAEVPFWCVIPKATPTHAPPFPVVLLAPDFGEGRVHLLTWAGAFARYGLATCALDGFGQTTALDPTTQASLMALEPGGAPSPLAVSAMTGRARDLDNDGDLDPDGDFMAGELAHSRDMVRQSALDWLQFVRVLRGFDGTRRWAVSRAEGALAGDFDGDGVPDLGGPTVAMHATGRGFGGNLMVLVAAVSPDVSRLAPVSAGAGLMDVLARTGDQALAHPFWSTLLGPLVVGVPSEGGATALTVVLPGRPAVPVAFDEQLLPGDRVSLRNLDNGQVGQAVASGMGTVRVAVAGDGPDPDEVRARLKAAAAGDDPPRAEELGDRLRLEVIEAGGRTRIVETLDLSVERFGARLAAGAPWIALTSGFGLRRQTPRLRRFLQVAQTVLDGADPVHLAPRILAEAGQDRDVLVLLTAGDPVVPVSAGLALARAFGLRDEAAEAQLIAAGAVEGLARRGPLVDVGALGEAGAAARLDPPIQLSATAPGGRMHLRLAWLGDDGQHGFGGPTAGPDGGAPAALLEGLARFLATGTPP